MIRRIEEYSLNAWPALQTLLYDGWVLRFANGFTRRANSVNPLYASTISLDEKIAVCEARYRDHGLPICYKLTTLSQPINLDNVLDAQGYTVDAPTSVQTLALSPAASIDPRDVEIVPTLTVEWHTEFARMNAVAAHRRPVHEQILSAILPTTGFAAVRRDGRLAACGLGVLQDGYLGLFDIVTDPAYRRQGFARQLICALLAWGIRQGAQTAYLQVMLNNQPALNLYDGLGFSESYRYWYRVKPLPEANH